MRGPALERIRRLAGISCCAVGGLLAAHAGVRYAVGSYRAGQARLAWEEMEAHQQVALSRTRAGQQSYERPVTGAPVARLVIPSIGLDEIVLEGVGDDELNAGPGHLPGSALPGRSGNAVISAHRDRHFDRLGELHLGDTITTESGQSKDFWVIVARRIVGHETPALFHTTTPTLTLTTCWPIRYLGTAPDRLILTARPVPTASVAASAKLGSASRS